MPSASKPDCKVSVEALDSIKQVINVVEKKVRNLEKRKGKLDQYRQKDEEGEILNRDQKDAIEKYDSVITTLDFARELHKHFITMGADAEKVQRKQSKRDKIEKHSAEMKKVQELLRLQGLLDNMGSENVREDFKDGKNGAIKLAEENLDQLDSLYKLVSPSRDGENGYDAQLTSASEHLVNFLDARDKEVCGTTYKDLNDMVTKIINCSYFDHTEEKDNKTIVEEVTKVETEVVAAEDVDADIAEAEIDNTAELQAHDVQMTNMVNETKITENLMAAPVQPVSSLTTQNLEELAQTIPTEQDDSFFSTANYNGPRAFTEIVSSVKGSFDFLQDSHIESQTPHIDPAVVAVQPMAMPTMSQQQSLGIDFGQNSITNLQTSRFTNDQTMAQQIDQTGISSSDVPPSIPLPNQTSMDAQSQSTNQEKKHFMNPNAVTFQSMYQSQSSNTNQQTDGYEQQPSRNTNSNMESNYENDEDYQGNGNYAGNYRNNRGNNRNPGRGGRGMSNGYTQRGGRSNNSYNNRGFGSNNRGNNRGSYQGYPPRSDYQPEGYQDYNNGTNNYGKRSNTSSRGAPRGAAGMRGGGHRGAGGIRGNRGVVYNSGASRTTAAAQGSQ